MDENIYELFWTEFPETMTYVEINEKLSHMREHEHYKEFAKLFCDSLVNLFTQGFREHDFDKGLLFTDENEKALLYEAIERLDEDECFYWAFYYFIKKDNRKCEEYLRKHIEFLKEKKIIMDEETILDIYLAPYKNAYEGFWAYVKKIITDSKIEVKEGIYEFLDLIEEYYSCSSEEKMVEILATFMQKYPDYQIPREWLGYSYQQLGMWNNVIACYEVIDDSLFFFLDDIYFSIAWAYGKLKQRKEEEQYYRKCLEVNPCAPFANNNLGYALYNQKKYMEAKEVFEKCLENNIDTDYAANNYVRALLALERYKDAHDFISLSGYKVSGEMKKRVLKHDKKNKTSPKKTDNLDNEEIVNEMTCAVPKYGIKRQQFSSEKILEDELTARIESGIPVFGLNLKVYRRRGEYGRQYRIPVGRLDLLCEDSENNLYIIELKKDSGYDDVYKQISDYLDWFDNSPKFKNKKIYGIICLNNPTDALIEKVHNNPRIKLYEYQIAYIER